MQTKTTVEFLRDVLIAAQIEGSRGRLDIFADRLVKAASEPTLAGAMESLMRSVNAGERQVWLFEMLPVDCTDRAAVADTWARLRSAQNAGIPRPLIEHLDWYARVHRTGIRVAA